MPMTCMLSMLFYRTRQQSHAVSSNMSELDSVVHQGSMHAKLACKGIKGRQHGPQGDMAGHGHPHHQQQGNDQVVSQVRHGTIQCPCDDAQLGVKDQVVHGITQHEQQRYALQTAVCYLQATKATVQ